MSLLSYMQNDALNQFRVFSYVQEPDGRFGHIS